MTKLTSASFADDPIDRAEDDTIGRAVFAKRIQRALEAADTAKKSSVLALIGPWGSGKTSVLRLLREGLLQGERWRWVEFDPWFYSDESSMQLGFLNELQGAMRTVGGTFSRTQAAKRGVQEIGKLMAATAPLVSAATSLLPFDFGAATGAIGGLLGGEATASQAFDPSRKALEEVDVPFIVVLDDLDRLDPAELLLVAKLVRLVGRLPNVYYLLSYDEQTLVDLLAASPLVGQDSSRASDYLEKIVQLRFDLPPPRPVQIDDAVETALQFAVGSLGLVVPPDALDRFRDAYQAHLRDRLVTPRAIGRFFAQVSLVEADILSELNLSDYLLLTWFRVQEPSIYMWIIRHRDFLLGFPREAMIHSDSKKMRVQRRHALVTSALDEADVPLERRDGLVQALAILFPVIAQDWREDDRAISVNLDEVDLRVFHQDYFDRYFGLEVPSEDISNADVAASVQALVHGHLESPAFARLRGAFNRDPRLISRKLQPDAISAEPLAHWMAKEFAVAVGDERWVGGVGTAAQDDFTDALFVVPEDDLGRFLSEVAREESGLAITAQTLRKVLRASMPPRGISQETFNAIIESARTVLPDIFAEHFKHESRDPIDGATDLWSLIWTWRLVAPEATREWIQAQVESGRWDLFRTVGALTPMGISGSGVRSIVEPLQRAQLLEYFDPGWLTAHKQVNDLDFAEMDLLDTHEAATPEALIRSAKFALKNLVRDDDNFDSPIGDE